MATTTADYCQDSLPPSIVEKLEAGAFRQLCRHLQERSDEVQNMDLMTLSGFCRNCLAKWMVLEARTLVDTPTEQLLLNQVTIQALNSMGYEEAAQHVYGMTYGDWKKRHQKKATDEQMEKFKASAHLQAKHDKQLLATRGATDDGGAATNTTTAAAAAPSNVCCQDVEKVAAPSSPAQQPSAPQPAKNTRTLPPYQSAPLPKEAMNVKVAILTVSDRAFKGAYETGDLSGPAVEQALASVLGNDGATPVKLQVANKSIVPDEMDAIEKQLIAWCDDDQMDLVFTTGGTGMSPRDVTPQATCRVLDTECAGLMQFVLAECSKLQPLATLSRGTAGIRGTTLIANLPGNPKGVGEIMPLLLPLLLHAQRHVHGR